MSGLAEVIQCEVREPGGSSVQTLQIPRKVGEKGKPGATCWSQKGGRSEPRRAADDEG